MATSRDAFHADARVKADARLHQRQGLQRIIPSDVEKKILKMTINNYRPCPIG